MADAQERYIRLGTALQSMPDLLSEGQYSPETMHWLARTYALVAGSGSSDDTEAFRIYMDNAVVAFSPLGKGKRAIAISRLVSIVYRRLAVAERNAPAAAQGAFIPAGNVFDAMAAFAKIVGSVTKDLLIVDPYMDEKALMEFAVTAPVGVPIRLLSDVQTVKPTLRPAAERWAAQHGSKWPLSVRLSAARTLHDRLLVVDSEHVWVLTQSLNAIATRSPATIARIEGDTRLDKIAAYETIWGAAKPL